MRTTMLAAAVLLSAGCTASPKPVARDAEAQKALGQRIDQICSLPEPDRTQAVAQLKKDTGMELLCGAKQDEESSAPR